MLAISLCAAGLRWPARLVRVIVIVIVVAAAARWDPGALVPLAAGSGLWAWLAVPPASVPAAAR